MDIVHWNGLAAGVKGYSVRELREQREPSVGGSYRLLSASSFCGAFG